MTIRYNPEDFGVTFVAEFDVHEPDYSFDLVLVVQDKQSNEVYVAFDSGCSCPSPFEDHSYPQDFVHVRTWDEVKRFVNEHRRSYSYALPITDSFRRAVRGALNA